MHFEWIIYPYIIWLNYTLVSWKNLLQWIKQLFWMLMHHIICYQKFHLLISLLMSSQGRSFKPTMADKIFQNSNFSLANSNVIIDNHNNHNNKMAADFLKLQVSSPLIFVIMTANHAHFLPDFPPKWNWCSLKKGELVQLAAQSPMCFALRQPMYFSLQKQSVTYASHFTTKNIKKTWTMH